MTNHAFVKSVAEASGRTQKDTKEFLDSVETVLKTQVSTLPAGEKVKVMDVTYSVKDVESRECRNPSTGDKFMAPATKALKIKASKDFKSIVK